MEPILVSLRFSEAMETPMEIVTENVGQFELKLYVPLPYGGNWKDENPNHETYQDSTGIYNIVGSRYANDTLFLTLQPNLNAHAQFDALSSAINSLAIEKDSENAPESPKTFSLTDLSKLFSPPVAPAIVRHFDNISTTKHQNVWAYTNFVSTHFFPVFAPPPENII